MMTAVKMKWSSIEEGNHAPITIYIHVEEFKKRDLQIILKLLQLMDDH